MGVCGSTKPTLAAQKDDEISMFLQELHVKQLNTAEGRLAEMECPSCGEKRLAFKTAQLKQVNSKWESKLKIVVCQKCKYTKLPEKEGTDSECGHCKQRTLEIDGGYFTTMTCNNCGYYHAERMG
mmetsp:Transcript_100589/g.194253  ORF Transcript_100589/g.194253 Transcript_100589/m.194253 type:complete len:125 (-) Transcript_100589:76-450(-)